jgi:hypothetical protein
MTNVISVGIFMILQKETPTTVLIRELLLKIFRMIGFVPSAVLLRTIFPQ